MAQAINITPNHYVVFYTSNIPLRGVITNTCMSDALNHNHAMHEKFALDLYKHCCLLKIFIKLTHHQSVGRPLCGDARVKSDVIRLQNTS